MESITTPYRLGLVVSVAFLLFFISCKDNPASSGKSDPNPTIEITVPQTELWVEERLQLIATVTTGGDPIEEPVILWKSSKPEILEVNDAGMLVAIESGDAVITATYRDVSKSVGFKIYSYSIVYERAVERVPHIYSLDLKESAIPKAVTGIQSYSYEPVVSPGGRQMAYAAFVDSYNPELYLFDFGTSQYNQLTDDPGIDDMPAWSPDGSKIAFRSHVEKKFGDIFVYNLSDHSLVNLTPDPAGVAIEERQPAWSPDGSQIVYSSNAAGNMDLWIMDADGKNKQQLTSTDHYDTEATWAPDGSSILFRRSYESESDLLIYDLNTKEIERIELPGYQRMPDWSPDGKWIAYVTQPTLEDRPEINVMRPDGTDIRLVTRDPAWEGGQNPSFIHP